MCGHWQGEGEMGCGRWPGFEGGVGVGGQGGSEVILQVSKDHGAGGRHRQCECRKPSYNSCGAGAGGRG